MQCRHAIPLLLVLCLTVGARAAVTELRTAGQEATEPKFIAAPANGGGQVSGLCMDILHAIEHLDPGLKFVMEQRLQPALRLEAGVASGNLEVVCGFVRNAQREAKFRFLEPMLFQFNFYLTARADDEVRITGWDDVRKLGGKGVVLVAHGFGTIQKLEGVGGLVIDSSANSSKLNLDKLVAGHGRFYYHRSPGIQGEIRAAGVQGKVKVLPAVLDSLQFYMVVSKMLPEVTAERLRKAIVQLDASKELARLLAKWEED
jgi:ABC-type amino acid transport substrate-binding protein